MAYRSRVSLVLLLARLRRVSRGKSSRKGRDDSHSYHRVAIAAVVLVAADIPLVEQRRLELLQVSMQAVPDISLEI